MDIFYLSLQPFYNTIALLFSTFSVFRFPRFVVCENLKILNEIRKSIRAMKDQFFSNFEVLMIIYAHKCSVSGNQLFSIMRLKVGS